MDLKPLDAWGDGGGGGRVSLAVFVNISKENTNGTELWKCSKQYFSLLPLQETRASQPKGVLYLCSRDVNLWPLQWRESSRLVRSPDVWCLYRVSLGDVPDFGRMFLTLKYTNITQNTYIRSWTVTEIIAREFWKYDSCYTRIDYQIHIKTGRNMEFL